MASVELPQHLPTATPAARSATRLWILLLAVALVVVGALVYWPGLSGPFLFDDYPNIVSNPKVHAQTLDLATLKRAAAGYEPGQIGRPLATLSFALNYYFGQDHPWGYKLTSLLVHLVNVLLVFALLRVVARLGKMPAAAATSLAFVVALLWAVHPLQVSSVLYVVQRMETLSLTFVLLALLSYLHGRSRQIETGKGWPWLFASAALALAGLSSKETAVLFPVYALALELTVLRFAARNAATARLLKVGHGVIIVAGLAIFLGWALPHALAPGAFSGRSFSLYERLLSQCRILPMYLGQMLLPIPSHMTFYYDAYPASTGWLSPPTTLLGALLLAALLATAWWARRRLPLVALGIFWFFAAHLLTSNVFGLELAFEHRNYFALLGVLLAIGDLVRRIQLRDGPMLKYVAVGAVMLACAGLGAIRSATWGKELLLFNELVDINRQSPRAANDLGSLLVAMANGDPTSPFYSMGEQQFERASRLPRSSPLPEQGLILMAAVHGQPVKDEWWQRFIDKVRTRPISPEETMAVSGLLKQRYEGVDLDDGRLREAYLVLLDRGPQAPFMYAQFGDYALNYLHDEDLADRMFVEAIERGPTDRAYAERIVANLIEEGHSRQARAAYDKGVQLKLFSVQGQAAPRPIRKSDGPLSDQ